MNYKRLCEIIVSYYDKDIAMCNINKDKKTELSYIDYLNLSYVLCSEQKTISEKNFRKVLYNLVYINQLFYDKEKNIVSLINFYDVKEKQNKICNKNYDLTLLNNKINKKCNKLLYGITEDIFR